jgi:D-alanyl-D-alanine dipeptidase
VATLINEEMSAGFHNYQLSITEWWLFQQIAKWQFFRNKENDTFEVVLM